MSITLKSISLNRSNPQITSKVPHTFEEDVEAVARIVKNNVLFTMTFKIRKGFECDGASVPKIFQWFLPSWDEKNPLYNIGSAIHDGLYIHKGFNIFSREECDDVLRGIWRESGIGRIKAGIADKCVEWFAGGDEHWGNDSYGVGDLFEMDF